MQKIWVCGARGQIGQAVNDVVDKLEFEMLDTDVDDLDVTDTDEVLRFGEMNRPDIIINCSGMTDISSCEENPSQAFKVNALGARNLAIVAAKMQAKMEQKNNPRFSIVIRADKDADYGKVITLLDRLKGAGVQRFGLATDVGAGE